MKTSYEPILKSHKTWPIVTLTKNATTFKNTVLKYTTNRLLNKYVSEENLYNLILKIKSSELENIRNPANKPRNRIAANESFWLNIEIDLENYTSNQDLYNTLTQIVAHYFDEITGNFSAFHYNLAKKCVSYTLSRLLTPIIPNTSYKNLHDRIRIEGDIDQIRNLAKLGTVIVLPNHFSNLDSAIISWVLAHIGLPPFMYGAGINLFNKRFWHYALSKVGAYKIDRDKKNPIYLTTLENYSCVAIQSRCHSVFYPHGTRSRTGASDNKIKKGLLHSVLVAQERNYEIDNTLSSKIFLVPVVFNYPFVLEAPLFAKTALSSLDPDIDTTHQSDKDHRDSFKIYNKLIKAKNLLSRQSHLSVRFGTPIDVLAYEIDNNGNSHDTNGHKINTYHHLSNNIKNGTYRNEDHINLLCKKITDAYKRYTTILPCNLTAYAAVDILINQFGKLQLVQICKNTPPPP